MYQFAESPILDRILIKNRNRINKRNVEMWNRECVNWDEIGSTLK